MHLMIRLVHVLTVDLVKLLYCALFSSVVRHCVEYVGKVTARFIRVNHTASFCSLLYSFVNKYSMT